ncbi:flavodoxin domain-containing protein, partial [Myxococcota bacterium]|nr:flavodoxin domain-containing protein [Myxococcota bacterium]MBU1536055.1 flavodoxin domain-containing protein [Myxococcota bacterium]
MKTLIFFSTKHGAAEKFARLISDALPGSEVRNAADGAAISFEDYDALIIGSSLYAGRMQKRFRKLISSNLHAILKKPVYLFVVGGEKDKYLTAARENLPPELMEHAACVEYAGHIYDLKQMNFFERLIMRMVAKVRESEFALREEAALRIAAAVKEHHE